MVPPLGVGRACRAAVLWTAVFVTRPFVRPPWGQSREDGWGPIEHIPGNASLLVAFAHCVWAAVKPRLTDWPPVRQESGGPTDELL